MHGLTGTNGERPWVLALALAAVREGDTACRAETDAAGPVCPGRPGQLQTNWKGAGVKLALGASVHENRFNDPMGKDVFQHTSPHSLNFEAALIRMPAPGRHGHCPPQEAEGKKPKLSDRRQTEIAPHV